MNIYIKRYIIQEIQTFYKIYIFVYTFIYTLHTHIHTTTYLYNPGTRICNLVQAFFHTIVCGAALTT